MKPTIRMAATLSAMLCLSACGEDSVREAIAQFRRGNHAAAHPALIAAADRGEREAAKALATQFYLGLGTARDLPKAARYYEQAALRGDIPSQLQLGVLYLNGWGVRRDHSTAFGWLQAAADGGSRHALDYLATMTDKLTPNQMTRAREAVRARLAASREP